MLPARAALLVFMLSCAACTPSFEEKQEAVREAFNDYASFNGRNSDERAIVEDMYTRIAPDMSKQQECETSFESAWTLAKQGNLETHFDLGMSAAYGFIVLRQTPTVTIKKDTLIFFIHSAGSLETLKNAESKRARRPHFTAQEKENMREMFFNDSELQSCVEKHPSPACAQMAVDKGYIPTFEAFAAEIEANDPDFIKHACERNLDPRNQRRSYQ